MDQQNITAAANLLAKPQKIVVTGHKAPDGDAIGSVLGLMHYLRKKGHDVGMVVPDAFPHFLKWLPGNKEILKFNRHWSACKDLFRAADIIFILDYNSLSRVGEMGKFMAQTKAKKIVIDHHQQPDDFPDVLFSDTSASSTCQMIYEFIDALGDADKVDADIATCLYTGIMTDTGSFRFSATSPKTHRIIANLMEAGAQNWYIHEQVLDSNSYARLRLVGYALTEKMKVLPDLQTAIIYLTNEELERYEFKKGDTEGLVNYGLSILGIRLAIFVRETDGVTKISLRSKGDFNVNEMARAHFNGGGHINAAGGSSPLSVEETVAEIESILPQYEASLTSS